MDLRRFIAACATANLPPDYVRFWIRLAQLPTVETMYKRDRALYRELCGIIEGLRIPREAHDFASRRHGKEPPMKWK